MTLKNAEVLHAHFLKIGRHDKALQLEARYPSLIKPEPELKQEKKKHGKKSKR